MLVTCIFICYDIIKAETIHWPRLIDTVVLCLRSRKIAIVNFVYSLLFFAQLLLIMVLKWTIYNICKNMMFCDNIVMIYLSNNVCYVPPEIVSKPVIRFGQYTHCLYSILWNYYKPMAEPNTRTTNPGPHWSF